MSNSYEQTSRVKQNENIKSISQMKEQKKSQGKKHKEMDISNLPGKEYLKRAQVNLVE